MSELYFVISKQVSGRAPRLFNTSTCTVYFYQMVWSWYSNFFLPCIMNQHRYIMNVRIHLYSSLTLIAQSLLNISICRFEKCANKSISDPSNQQINKSIRVPICAFQPQVDSEEVE